MTDGGLERRLGTQRLTARSVIASTLLGVTPPELSTRSLVGTAELLGIAAGTARVAMSRMVAARELEPTGHGYRLVSPTLLARQERQNRSREGITGGRSVAGATSATGWSGDWRMVVVTGEARPQADRTELRTTLTAGRYAELREGVWLRPDNLGSMEQPAGQAASHALVGMVARPDDPVALAAALWDLDGWANRARLLLAEVERLGPDLEAGEVGALAEGFVVSAAVLRHFQIDPLLPVDLLPQGWPGAVLRERYDAYDDAFRATLANWQRDQQRT